MSFVHPRWMVIPTLKMSVLLHLSVRCTIDVFDWSSIETSPRDNIDGRYVTHESQVNSPERRNPKNPTQHAAHKHIESGSWVRFDQ